MWLIIHAGVKAIPCYFPRAGFRIHVIQQGGDRWPLPDIIRPRLTALWGTRLIDTLRSRQEILQAILEYLFCITDPLWWESTGEAVDSPHKGSVNERIQQICHYSFQVRMWQNMKHWMKISDGACHLAAITDTIILVPYLWVKSLWLIWR